MQILGLNGQMRNHMRCRCDDCNTKYAQHNTSERCGCSECVDYRENGQPIPPITRPTEYRAEWQTPERHLSINPQPQFDTTHVRISQGYDPQRVIKRPEVKVSSIHVCMREGCESLVVSSGLATLQIRLNPYSIDGSKAGADIVGELCPMCAADIDRLLHTEPMEDRPRKQDKPYRGWDEFAEDDAVLQASDDQLLAELLRRNMRTKAIGQ